MMKFRNIFLQLSELSHPIDDFLNIKQAKGTRSIYHVYCLEKSSIIIIFIWLFYRGMKEQL